MKSVIIDMDVLNTPALIALAVMKGCMEAKKGTVVKVTDLTGYLMALEKAGIDISRISLRHSPEGLWSEDIAKYITEEEVHGRMRQFSNEQIQFGKNVDDCFNEHRTILQSIAADGSSVYRGRVAQAMAILRLGPLN